MWCNIFVNISTAQRVTMFSFESIRLLFKVYFSWYSWTLHSMVNGVYAFGFLFMLPQLFINYKLKSVAALPWRAFMYKAFNTFIDDVFAFIITMPVAHRVACFRDDIVFIIYLYQRWYVSIGSNTFFILYLNVIYTGCIRLIRRE
jgi:hypothetical protein